MLSLPSQEGGFGSSLQSREDSHVLLQSPEALVERTLPIHSLSPGSVGQTEAP